MGVLEHEPLPGLARGRRAQQAVRSLCTRGACAPDAQLSPPVKPRACRHLGDSVAGYGCPLASVPAFVYRSAIREAGVISPWNPINYRVWERHLSYNGRTKACAQAGLDYALVFEWGPRSPFLLHPSNRSPRDVLTVTLQWQSLIK